MQRERNILIFPVGTEVGLETYRALKDVKGVKIFSASDDAPNHSNYVVHNHSVIPGVRDEAWVEALNELIREHDIHYIFPGNDIVLDALISRRDDIEAKVMASPTETCKLIRSKSATYDRFKDILPVPQTFTEVESFPVFVKPDDGYGSQGAERVDNAEVLAHLLEKNPKLIISEHLEGREFTIDCFTDRRKGLLFVSARDRRRIRMGTALRSGIQDDARFRKYAELINDELDLHGTWYFQMKEDSEGNLKLLEIASRVAGSMGLHRVIGLNFPLLSIYDEEGVNIDILLNKSEGMEIDRVLGSKFSMNFDYDRIYVDLDDTIIVNGKLNLPMISFLYQGLNKGCKII